MHIDYTKHLTKPSRLTPATHTHIHTHFLRLSHIYIANVNSNNATMFSHLYFYICHSAHSCPHKSSCMQVDGNTLSQQIQSPPLNNVMCNQLGLFSLTIHKHNIIPLYQSNYNNANIPCGSHFISDFLTLVKPRLANILHQHRLAKYYTYISIPIRVSIWPNIITMHVTAGNINIMCIIQHAKI